MQGTLGCLKVPSIKLSIRHVHGDWQMVSNATNQNSPSVNYSQLVKTTMEPDQSTRMDQ